MKKKSAFSQLLTVVMVALIGFVVTMVIAFWVGSADTQIFDLREINWGNAIPVILIGGFATCVAVGIAVLVVSKNIFLKVRDYFLEDKIDGGKK